jgi:hypothetical protein
MTTPHVLRSSGTGHGTSDDGGCWIVRIEPGDGAVCVFRDAPVVVRFSGCLDAASVGADAFRVMDDRGPLAGELRLSPDARVLIWEPLQPLAANLHHFVMASGLRDARGRAVSTHLSRFLTCGLMRKDLSG